MTSLSDSSTHKNIATILVLLTAHILNSSLDKEKWLNQ